MAPHVSAQCVAAGVRLTLSTAVHPLAGVLLLSGADVLIVDVLDQIVHVAKVAGAAAIPLTRRDLIAAFATVVLVDGGADQRQGDGGVGDLAGGV